MKYLLFTLVALPLYVWLRWLDKQTGDTLHYRLPNTEVSVDKDKKVC